MGNEVLSAAGVIRNVDERTGLARFLTAGTRERLEATVELFNREADLSPETARTAYARLEATLAARLKLARDRHGHPSIAAETIERPIFVIGFSRTGTTVMHCLLGCDPANRFVSWAESMHPSPPPGLRDAAGELERTIGAFRDLAGWIDKARGMMPGHPYPDIGIRAPVEDEELYALDFLVPYPSRYFDVPLFPTNTASNDPATAYDFHRQLLQHLQWRCAPRRWVSKGIFHAFCLEALLDRFPDACCIWTHRDPVEIVASTLKLTTDLYDPIRPGIGHKVHAARMLAAMKAGFDHFLALPVLDDPRIHHVRFKDFMNDQIGTIRHAYETFGLEFSPLFEAGMALWLADPNNRSDRYGKFAYDLSAYGLSRGQIAETFSNYSQRFDLT